MEAEIQALVKAATGLDSTTAVAEAHYGRSWPAKYHLCPERGNLLRHLCFEGLSVLELGAGMGGVSRFLAENCRTLRVVEGTAARYAVLQERLRDLKNWSGTVANIEEAPVTEKADVVCVIGVLEYAEMFMQPPAGFAGGPFGWFLERARAHLKEDGVLILAIENKLGLKYWSGAAEDHTGKLFDGICGYAEKRSPRTFSRREMLGLLHAAGLGAVEEYFPFPDYKLPKSVVTGRLMELSPKLAAGLATTEPYRNYNQPRVKFFPETLAAASVSAAGLLPELANSFLFVASQRAESPVLRQLIARQTQAGEVGWRYANYRKLPTRTAFFVPPGTTEIHARKSTLRPDDVTVPVFEGAHVRLKWHELPAAPVAAGEENRERLARRAYFEGPERCYELLREFIGWSLKKWEAPAGSTTLAGRALDASLMNACRSPERPEEFELFDLEWELLTPMPKSWFVLRCLIYPIADHQSLQNHPAFRTRTALYHRLCSDLGVTPDLAADIQREAEFQSLIGSGNSPEAHRQEIAGIFEKPLPRGSFPRKPSQAELLARALADNVWVRRLANWRRLPQRLRAKLLRREG